MNFSISRGDPGDLNLEIIHEDSSLIESAQGVGKTVESISINNALGRFSALDSITIIGGFGTEVIPTSHDIRQIILDQQVTADDDRIDGYFANDTIRAGAGEDLLSGGGGRDKLIGGAGDDDLRGNGGRDMLKGGRGADDLSGGAGRDVLKGGGGDDRIEGGKGADRLLGQGGEDTFVFARGFGSDVVTDFNANADMLDFSGHANVSALGDLALSQAGDDVIILDGVGGRIKLLGVDVDDLQSDDFLF